MSVALTEYLKRRVSPVSHTRRACMNTHSPYERRSARPMLLTGTTKFSYLATTTVSEPL